MANAVQLNTINHKVQLGHNNYEEYYTQTILTMADVELSSSHKSKLVGRVDCRIGVFLFYLPITLLT